MAFLLHIGCIGLKCPVLGQKALIGLKNGLILPGPAFLNSFLCLEKYVLPLLAFFGQLKSLMVSRG
jgi:hypothetical protein